MGPRHSVLSSGRCSSATAGSLTEVPLMSRPQRAAAARAKFHKYLDSDYEVDIDDVNNQSGADGRSSRALKRTSDNSDADYTIQDEEFDEEEGDEDEVGHVVPVQPALMEKRVVEEPRQDSFMQMIQNLPGLTEGRSLSIADLNSLGSLRGSFGVPFSPTAHDPGLLHVSPHQVQALAQAVPAGHGAKNHPDGRQGVGMDPALGVAGGVADMNRMDSTELINTNIPSQRLLHDSLGGSQGILLHQLSFGLNYQPSLGFEDLGNLIDSMSSGNPEIADGGVGKESGSDESAVKHDIEARAYLASHALNATEVSVPQPPADTIDGFQRQPLNGWMSGGPIEVDASGNVIQTQLLLSAGVTFPGRLASQSFNNGLTKNMSLELNLNLERGEPASSLSRELDRQNEHTDRDDVSERLRSSSQAGTGSLDTRDGGASHSQRSSTAPGKIETLRSVKAAGFRNQRGSSQSVADLPARLGSASPENSATPPDAQVPRRKNPTMTPWPAHADKMERVAHSAAAAAAVADERREEMLSQIRRARAESNAAETNEDSRINRTENELSQEPTVAPDSRTSKPAVDEDAELIDAPNQLFRLTSHVFRMPAGAGGSGDVSGAISHAGIADEATTRSLLKNMSIDRERAEEARAVATSGGNILPSR